MKVLSLYQPWATLVVLGAKKFETRSWATRYRGPLLIHASKKFPKAYRSLTFQAPFNAALQFRSWTILPTGKIIGLVDLVDCAPTDPSAIGKNEMSFGDWNPGRWAWKLEHAVAFNAPLPARGSLGLWEFPESALGHLAERQQV